MYVQCGECNRYYDDTESKPHDEGLGHRHIRVGMRPIDERVAERAKGDSALRRAYLDALEGR